MATEQTPEKVWHEASCHCGAVQYKVKVPPLESQKIMSCNCTICTKNGYFMVYPTREDIVFHSGKDHMKTYHFTGGEKSHMFCPTCGSSLMVDFHNTMRHIFGGDMLAVNVRFFSIPADSYSDSPDSEKVRMFKDVDISKLEFRHFDGLHEL